MIKDSVMILGQEYKIIKVNHDQHATCNDCDGWCDFYGKRIFYVDQTANSDCDPLTNDPEEHMKQVVRHEIVHAFLAESGLAFNTIEFIESWAINEEMVDWIAWNGAKIYNAWREVGVIA